MPSRGYDMQRIYSVVAGLVLGVCTALPTQAFTPFSGPILSASLAPANVMVLFDNSSSMALNRIDGNTRLDIAREATKAVIANNRYLHFGLFTFREAMAEDKGPGGVLLVQAGNIGADNDEGIARFAALNRILDSLNTGAQNPISTPLAESWYEVTRYLRGLRAFYPQAHNVAARDAFNSPIEYRCQKNIGLIVTDGLSNHDDQFPDNLLDEPDGNNPQVAGSFNLPDWDGDGADMASDIASGTDNSVFYLDDIARFAYEIDLRRTGVDKAGQSWDDPQFPVQSLRTYVLGFALDDPWLSRVARAGHGRYFTVNDDQSLQSALTSALHETGFATGSGGGSVSDSQRLTAGSSRYYQTQFYSTDWSGSLLAYQLDEAGQLDTLLWSTDNTFGPGNLSGDFQTWRKAEGGVPAGAVTLNHNSWAALSPSQQQLLETEARLSGLSGSGNGQRLLNWARGSADSDLRPRSRLLGDVIHSAPVLVGAGHHSSPDNQTADYLAYLQQRRNSMPEAILVGANDGFLRMFDTSGRHLYSYLPAAAHTGLGMRARPDYGRGSQHRSGVDGRIAVADIRLANQWSTVAAAGLGAGGKGVFAVRLFDTANGTAGRSVLWEAGSDQFDALGYIHGQPVIAQLHGKSVLITGNGYGSAMQGAALLIFDLHSGTLLRQLEVSNRPGANQTNGLSVPVLQLAADGELQAAFAGDLHGQLWKFELDSSDPGAWRVAHGGSPLFSAAEGQPITVQPQLYKHITGDGDLLLFGTGKLLEATDPGNTQVQAFYAVLDAPILPSGGLTPAVLQEQQISTLSDPVSGQLVRTVSSEPVDWGNQYGWYLTLTEVPGERIIRDAVIQHSRVMFTTGFIETASNDPCITRAGGWLMAVTLTHGGMPDGTLLDTNGDGRVDQSDIPAAGLELSVGLPGAFSVIDRDEQGQLSGCSAEVYLVQGSAGVAAVSGLPACQFSRIMWRQLQ